MEGIVIHFDVLLGNILLFCALAVPGYLLGKCGRITKTVTAGMTGILTDVAMPALVFSKLIATDIPSLGITAVICCILFPVLMTVVLCFLTRRIFCKNTDDAKVGASRFCAIFPNCGFLGIPLADAMFLHDGQVVVYVSLFNVFSTWMLLTVGIYLYSGNRRNICLHRLILKPVSLAVVLGAVCSLLHFGESLPALGTYADYLAALTTPLAMIILGAELSKLSLREIFSSARMYAVAAVKLVISPLAVMGALLLIKAAGAVVSTELATALFISTGVSTAASAPAMAERYGADAKLAAILTLGTTVLCVVSFPLISILFEQLF